MGDIAVIVGGGKGERAKQEIPKAFVNLITRPMIAYSAQVFYDSSMIDEVILVVPTELVDAARMMIDAIGWDEKPVHVVASGNNRQASVYNAIHDLQGGGYIAVHDAARPALMPEHLEALLIQAHEHEIGVVPVIPPADLIYEKGPSDLRRAMPSRTIDRVQTPQIISSLVLRFVHAHEEGGSYRDESTMLLRHKKPPLFVPGDSRNWKVTEAHEFAAMEGLLYHLQHPLLQ